jgi:hypothetical protein
LKKSIKIFVAESSERFWFFFKIAFIEGGCKIIVFVIAVINFTSLAIGNKQQKMSNKNE